VAKSLFVREISETFFPACASEARTRRCRPPEGDRQRSCASDSKSLENASEKAGAVAQQPAEHATDAAAASKAALTADIGVTQHILHRTDDLHTAADETVVFGTEAFDDVTQLVVSGQDTALVAEDPAFAMQKASDEAVQQPAVGSTKKATKDRQPL
jgi:hypothetical protein